MNKAVDEYREVDLEDTLDRAYKISFAVINNIWNKNKDDESVDTDDICAVKKAMKVLCIHRDIKKTMIK